MASRFLFSILIALAVVVLSVHCYPADEQIRRIPPGAGPAGPAAVAPPNAPSPAALNQETLKTDSSYGYGYAYPYYGYYYPRYYAYGYGYPHYSYYSSYWGWPYYR